MGNVNSTEEISLPALRAAHKSASEKIHRQETIERLKSLPGLRYSALGDVLGSPNLVAYNGEILGETHTTSPGVLHDWYGVPAGDENSELGPFTTARAAATGLLRASGLACQDTHK
ncbi:hypothetical protein [Streptomyces sp. NPDC058657]|uniref:hypothetical protein n=1 Tax=unclassified Streptomyces TaxID=2593676 RepID=UPI0036528004